MNAETSSIVSAGSQFFEGCDTALH